MNKQRYGIITRWEICCGILMLLALLITIFGSFVLFAPHAINGPMGGLGDGLFFVIWLFGALGLFVLFMANAFGKKVFAILGFGCSIAALVYGLVSYRCLANELCLYDTSDNLWLIAVCSTLLVALFVYDKKKEKIPTIGKTCIKVFLRSMIIAWACTLFFFAITLNV